MENKRPVSKVETVVNSVHVVQHLVAPVLNREDPDVAFAFPIWSVVSMGGDAKEVAQRGRAKARFGKVPDTIVTEAKAWAGMLPITCELRVGNNPSCDNLVLDGRTEVEKGVAIQFSSREKTGMLIVDDENGVVREEWYGGTAEELREQIAMLRSRIAEAKQLREQLAALGVRFGDEEEG